MNKDELKKLLTEVADGKVCGQCAFQNQNNAV